MTIGGYVLVGLGLFIVFWGNIGMIILPDTLTRFHAGTKCGATGTLTVLGGLIILSDGVGFAIKLVALGVVTLVSSPLIAHILGLSYLQYRQERERSRK